MICNCKLFALFNDLLFLVTVTETIETGIGRMTRVVRAKRKDVNAIMNPKRIEIGTRDTRDARWRGKKAAGRA